MNKHCLHGAGLGLRQEFLPDLRSGLPDAIDFFELAPENWMGMGGTRRKDLDFIANNKAIIAHGLSLSLGGPAPLDVDFLKRIKQFLDDYDIAIYSEHLSWCSAQGHLYDLLPIPATEEAIHHVAQRIRATQDILERRIAIENPTYYVAPDRATMSEAEFTRAVLEEADCDLHLDVNNVYVNSINFAFDAWQFIQSMPASRVVYIHVAGHYTEPDGLLIDTHGAKVIDPVWQLLERSFAYLGTSPPTLLERDFNIPPLPQLLDEVAIIRRLQAQQSLSEAHHDAA